VVDVRLDMELAKVGEVTDIVSSCLYSVEDGSTMFLYCMHSCSVKKLSMVNTGGLACTRLSFHLLVCSGSEE